MDKSIMPECYADTLLIETLIPTKNGYNHKNSCFKVESEMSKGKLKDRFAVGIVDNDKDQIKYLNEFVEIDKFEDSLILWKHSIKPHYIIHICPALERWILNVCVTAGINLADFDLSSEMSEFTKYTKSKASLEDKKLKNLFDEICKKDEIGQVKKLKRWLKLLKEKNYQVDINELKDG